MIARQRRRSTPTGRESRIEGRAGRRGGIGEGVGVEAERGVVERQVARHTPPPVDAVIQYLASVAAEVEGSCGRSPDRPTV